MTSAAKLKASLWTKIAPSTERSASRLCGSVRSAVATAVSAMNEMETVGAKTEECNRNARSPVCGRRSPFFGLLARVGPAVSSGLRPKTGDRRPETGGWRPQTEDQLQAGECLLDLRVVRFVARVLEHLAITHDAATVD